MCVCIYIYIDMRVLACAHWRRIFVASRLMCCFRLCIWAMTTLIFAGLPSDRSQGDLDTPVCVHPQLHVLFTLVASTSCISGVRVCRPLSGPIPEGKLVFSTGLPLENAGTALGRRDRSPQCAVHMDSLAASCIISETI